MSIPMNRDQVKQFIFDLRVKEQREEVQRRLQKDYSVFVSYSRGDSEVVKKVVEALETAGVEYHLDEKILELGDNIFEGLRERLEGATHYLLILAPNSVNSQWCIAEHGMAVGMKKTVIFYLSSNEVSIPPWAAPYLGTENLADIIEYFSRQLIDPKALIRFIVEITGEEEDRLREFLPAEANRAGQHAWDAPNRQEIENPKWSAMDQFVDDYRRDEFERLYRIEIDSSSSEKTLTLFSAKERYQPVQYTLEYRDELTGVMVSPEKKRAGELGTRHEHEDGRIELTPRRPSLQDQLSQNVAYGWDASRSFWEQTLRTLEEILSHEESEQ